MKEVLILYNKELDSQAFKYQYYSYKNSFEKLGITTQLKPTSDYITALFDTENNVTADAVIFLDKDVMAAALLEAKGHRLFNSSDCIRICDDKSLTYLELYKRGIAIPKTVTAPKTYSDIQSEKWCKEAANLVGYPLVIKECFGSLGMQVYMAENETQLLEIVKNLGTKPFVIQEYLEKGAGWDLRVITAGGEVTGAVKRSNTCDFRANAALGGKVEPYEPDNEQKRLALAAADAVGAFFSGVDLILGEDGYKVCEVNSNMLFEAADKALGISVAEKIAEKIKSIV